MPEIRAPEVHAKALLAGGDIEDAIAAYEDAGAIIVRGLIGSDWLGKLRGSYDAMAQEAYIPFVKGKPEPGMRQLMNRHQMWREEEPFRDFLFNSSIARAAALLMRSHSARLYEDILLTEPADQKAVFGWHQDEPTWPVSGGMLSSVWFSLQAVDDETGAMRFVKQSHRGPLYHPKHVNPEAAGEDARFWTGGAFPSDSDVHAQTVVLTDAAPGDAVVFHPRAIHTAYGSAKDRPRQSFTIRFLGDDVRWLPKKRVFHPWMNELGLNEGDKPDSPRLPMVWEA